MPRYFAFLRAINTGGRRLTNEELLAPFRALGLHDVAAYQAAGNVTFEADRAKPIDSERIEEAVIAAYGFATPVFLRVADELRTIVDAQPFNEAQVARTDGRIQVTFMREPLDAETIEAASALVPHDDIVRFVGREWYWLPRRGISDSELPVGRIEREVGPMTMRTLGTLNRLLTKFA